MENLKMVSFNPLRKETAVVWFDGKAGTEAFFYDAYMVTDTLAMTFDEENNKAYVEHLEESEKFSGCMESIRVVFIMDFEDEKIDFLEIIRAIDHMSAIQFLKFIARFGEQTD